MIGPETAARWLLWALGIGAGLGLLYGFLRPAPVKLRHIWDLVFVIAAFWGWLYLGFGICGGDLRFGCTAALAAGGITFDRSFGRLLAPLFVRFWDTTQKLFRLFSAGTKNILKKAQKNVILLLASGKKWFRIV